MSKMDHETIVEVRVACRQVIPVEAPDRVLLVPWGIVERVDGAGYVIDEVVVASIIDRFNRRTTITPFDYEHHTLGGKYTPPDGKAIAAGWITSLDGVPGVGIYATVEWTRAAAKHIQEKEYRYVSPVFGIRQSDGAVVSLPSAALTNTPALENAPAIVNKGDPMHEKFENARWFLGLGIAATEGEIMTEMEKFLNQLREAIGAKEDTDQAGVLSALKAQRDSASKFRLAVCKSVDLDPAKAEKTDDIIAAVNSAKATAKPSSSGDDVPRPQYEALASSHKALVERFTTLECSVNSESAGKRIQLARDQGKLTQADIEEKDGETNYWIALSQKPDEWDAWFKCAPQQMPKSGRVIANSAKPAGAGGYRGEIIAAAKAEFDSDTGLIACSLKEYVNEALREQSKDKLTDDETTTLAA